MQIRVYIDGCNLFYGRLKSTSDKGINAKRRKLRWFNPDVLVKQFLPPNTEIEKIYFYIADIKARYLGDKSPLRQQEYYKALMTLSNIQIVKGRYAQHRTYMSKYPITLIAHSDGSKIETVQVLKTEEKRSDVNIASHIVRDACLDRFDMAILVSNDSDLLEPMKIIQDLGKRFIILSPYSYHCQDFVSNFSSKDMRKIQEKHMIAAQFPDEIFDSANTLLAKRPAKWE